MRKYEIMFIVRPDLEEAEIRNVAESMKNTLSENGGSVVDFKEMGQRELAYEIKDFKSGYYFVFEVESKNDKAIKEFDRLALINKDIIRHLITKVED